MEARLRSVLHSVCSATALLTFAVTAYADPIFPDPVPGWTHTDTLSRDTDAHHGVPFNGAQSNYSSPVIAEIDGDSSNGKELAVGGADGVLHVFHADGTLLWESNLPNKSCTGASNANKLLSSPAVGELFGDGIPYVVVGYGGVGGRECGGGVIAFKGTDGSRRWHLDLRKFAKKEHFWSFLYSVFSTPALADVDGDGKLEIGFGAFDRNVYLLNSDGSVRWYYNAADTVWSSPAFADADGDGKLEMIIGTDISQNKALNPPTSNGGYVYAFKTDKRTKKRIGFRNATAYLWQKAFDQVIYASPVVADVLPSNPGNEVLIESGCYFPEHNPAKRGAWLKVLSLSSGAVLATLPMTACSSSTPAVADLDGDGILDIVATSSGGRSIGGDGSGHVFAWHGGDLAQMYDVKPLSMSHNDANLGFFQSPVIADLDGNGSLEVAVANNMAVSILDGITGAQFTSAERYYADNKPALNAYNELSCTPVIDDINNDGVLDIFVTGSHPSMKRRGMIYGWTNLSALIPSSPGIGSPYAAPWPMFRGHASRAGQ